MMKMNLKSIVRFLIVLGAACLLAVGIYYLVQANPDLLGAAAGHERGAFGGDNTTSFAPGAGFQKDALANGMGEAGFGGRGHGREGDLALLPGLAGVLKNVMIIGVMTLAVIAIQKVWRVFSWRKRMQPAA